MKKSKFSPQKISKILKEFELLEDLITYTMPINSMELLYKSDIDIVGHE